MWSRELQQQVHWRDKEELAEHWVYVIHNQTDKNTGGHLNLPCNNLANLKIAVMEKWEKKYAFRASL